jgi:hypothetical protein
MPAFELKRPITTDTSRIEVAAGLKPGRYRFQLVVIDTEGNASAPAEREVEIVRPRIPPIDRPPIVIRPPIDRPPIVIRPPLVDPQPIPPILRPPIPIVPPLNPPP